jgi:hypothetical protein
LINVLRSGGGAFFYLSVVIPTSVIKLDEANATLGETTS